jgi:hypothetical protein
MACILYALLAAALFTPASSQLAWEDVSTGISPQGPSSPHNFTCINIVARGGDAFAAVRNTVRGVYKFDSDSSDWSLYAPPVNKYGIGSLVVGSDGGIYSIFQGGLHALHESVTPRTWTRLARSSITSAATLAAGPNSKLYVHSNGTTFPTFQEFDIASGSIRDLQFPYGPLDGKQLSRRQLRSPCFSFHLAAITTRSALQKRLASCMLM